MAARRRLTEALAMAPRRLFPVWTLLPGDAGDGDGDADADRLCQALKAADVRAVRFAPKAHNYPFVRDVLNALPAALEARGILTLIDAGHLPGTAEGMYNSLSWLLGAHPKLPVLLQNISWFWQRVLTALMQRFDNLHVEFSTLQNNRGPETYAARFGAHRLLFGTGLPARSAGAARALIDYADVPEADGELLAGGNLSRLLGGLRPAPAPARPPDSLHDLAARGAPLSDVPVHDAHCHLLPDGADSAGAYVMYHGDADGLVEQKDRMGIRRTAIMSWSGPIGSDVNEGNEVVARAVHRYPARFLGVCYVNPTHRTADELVAELRRRVDEQGFVGLKPYVHIGVRYDDALYTPCWEFAAARGLYALCHLGGAAGNVDPLAALAADYPAAQWVVAHTGASFAKARQVAAAMRRHANIWAELTFTAATNGVIEWLVGEVGDDRILFGTDAPMRDPRPQFGWVVWADLPPASRRRILGENFLRLLSLRRPPVG